MRHAELVVVALLVAAVSASGQEPPRPAAVDDTVPGPAEVAYTPPPCIGIFPDVPCSHQFATWIEQLYRDRVTTGCGGGLYCPSGYVTRGQMAAFMERIMRGTEHWPPNVAYVHHVTTAGGAPDNGASGQALRAAIAAIPTTGPLAPSSTQRYAVLIGPGRFDISSGGVLTVPGYVDLVGTGREATEIYAAGGGYLNLDGSSRVSDLMIKRFSAGGGTYAIVARGSLKLQDAWVEAGNGTAFTIAVFVENGAYLQAHHTTLQALTSSGYGYGVYLNSAAESATLRDCDVKGSSAAVRLISDSTVYIAHSLILAPLDDAGPGSFKCFGNFSASYTAVACP